MVSNVVAHWYLYVIYIMAFIVLFAFVLFGLWCVFYVSFCGYNYFKFVYHKWIRRDCPHICLLCKYRRVCEYKNNPP